MSARHHIISAADAQSEGGTPAPAQRSVTTHGYVFDLPNNLTQGRGRGVDAAQIRNLRYLVAEELAKKTNRRVRVNFFGLAVKGAALVILPLTPESIAWPTEIPTVPPRVLQRPVNANASATYQDIEPYETERGCASRHVLERHSCLQTNQWRLQPSLAPSACASHDERTWNRQPIPIAAMSRYSTFSALEGFSEKIAGQISWRNTPSGDVLVRFFIELDHKPVSEHHNHPREPHHGPPPSCFCHDLARRSGHEGRTQRIRQHSEGPRMFETIATVER